MNPVTPSGRSRAATIRDVAREAGVSVATVSRVLNASPLVVEPTRARVQAAIEALGYRRSATAHNLSVGRAQGIGVVAPFFTTPSVNERLRGVVGRLAGRGYDLLLFDVEAPEQRADALRDFARRDRVDGVLIVSLPISDDEAAAFERDGLPAVLVDVVHPRLPHVVVDNVRGGELATQHLLAKGHERIGFVGDTAVNPYGFTSSEDRRSGYRRALEAAGIAPDPALERLGPYGRDEAEPLARALLAVPDPPTAVFAASDMQAIGVLKAARAQGVRVPQDLAVVGFDDVDLADILGLTTVHQPLWETGALGADLLLAAVEQGDTTPRRELQPLRLVVRETT
jgi:LacI family transcriptional regulator/LacI family repressor for deo operon, udp, cdd, tsx, nupC, and nupG